MIGKFGVYPFRFSLVRLRSARFSCTKAGLPSLPSQLRFHSTNESAKALLFSRPLPERVAAVFVAQQLQQQGQNNENQALLPPSEKGPVMPVSDFIKSVPSLTRDTIFRQNMDVEEWISCTKLMRLVYLEEDQQWLTAEEHKLRWASISSEKSSCSQAQKETRHFGAMQFIGLNFQPEEVLSICEEENAVPSASLLMDPPHEAGAVLEALAVVLSAKEPHRSSRWFFLNEAILLAKKEASKYSRTHPLQFFARENLKEVKKILMSPFVEHFLWVKEDELMLAHRRPDDKEPPVSSPPQQPRTRKPSMTNNFGGWGSGSAIPTQADVYEILRYVPVNWGNFGILNIPAAVKKKHIRTSSTLLWFRRQPYYFELRNMGGTVEIRRSPMLHPDQHNMTPEEAEAYVERGISTGTINSMAVLGPDGKPVQQASPVGKNLHKFLYRACPSYFVPFGLLFPHLPKKNITIQDLQDFAANHPQDFEIVSAMGLPHPFVRKRAGADSTRWKKAFVDDLTSRPKDIPVIGAICNHLCATWDRAEYVYVLLTSAEKTVVGSFDEMMEVIRRHQELFRVGETFICRIDSSDPLCRQQPEPLETEMTSRTYNRNENPYLRPEELVKVFHYITSGDEIYSPSFFLSGSSPAMKVALPSRITQILQEYPHLFICKETSPGVFSIRKVESKSRQRWLKDKSSDANASLNDPQNQEDSSWILQDEERCADNMTKEELIQAVKQLIPSEGVDYERLLLWASLQVQSTVNQFYGSFMKMVETETKHFTVTKSEDGIRISKFEG